LISPLLCFKVFTHPSTIPKTVFIVVVGGFMILWWFMGLNLRWPGRILLSPLITPALILVVIFILSLIGSDYLYGGIFELLNFVIFLLIYLMVVNHIESSTEMDRIVVASTITGVIVSVIGISQYYGFPIIDLPQDHPPGATFYYKNMAGQYIMMIIPLSLYLLVAGRGGWMLRVYAFVATISMITFLYCSGSRASSAGLLSGLIITGLLHILTGRSQYISARSNRVGVKGLRLSRLLFSLVLIYLLISLPGYIERVSSDPAKIGSAKTRVSLWLNTMEMIRDNPLLGVGLGGWKVEYPLYHNAITVTKRFSEHEQPLRAHNDYLQLTAETGIPGLIISLWMIFLIFRMSWRICRYEEDRDARLKGLFFTMSLSALLVNALFSFPFRLPVSSFFFVLILGMLTVLYHVQGGVSVIQVKRPSIIRMASVIIIPLVLYVIFLNVGLAIAEINYYQAQVCSARGDLGSAIRKAERARDIYPYHYRIRLYCGILYLRSGRYDDAIRENLEALRLRPHDTSAHNNLGIAYLKKGEYDRAIREFQAKLRIIPDSLITLKNLARVYIRIGDLDRAIEVYKKAISYHPDDASLHFILGAIYAKEGRIDNAVAEVERAVMLEPENNAYNDTLDILLKAKTQ